MILINTTMILTVSYVLFDKDKLWSNTNEEYFEYSQKLINRQASDSLIAAYDDKGFSLLIVLIFNYQLMLITI